MKNFNDDKNRAGQNPQQGQKGAGQQGQGQFGNQPGQTGRQGQPGNQAGQTGQQNQQGQGSGRQGQQDQAQGRQSQQFQTGQQGRQGQAGQPGKGQQQNQEGRNIPGRNVTDQPGEKLEKNPDWDETREGREVTKDPQAEMEDEDNNEDEDKNEDDDETDESTCSRCGMARSEWSVNFGKGVEQNEETYCCEGCANDTGCTCEEAVSNSGSHPGQGID